MCCLFGLIDYGGQLTVRQKNHLVTMLSIAAEDRGTDATGIAYNTPQGLQIYKRPSAAHKLHLHVSGDTKIVMGHTRMTTQGSARKNRNNHPFPGVAGREHFALAHNGVLFNDYRLRSQLKLPETRVETDSYIAVQMLEQQRKLDWDSLRYMAEKLEGGFSITVLSEHDKLYFVKGDSPLTICHFPTVGVYLYASTSEILESALRGCRNWLNEGVELPISCGELLSIDTAGRVERSFFDASNLRPYSRYCSPLWDDVPLPDDSYVAELKAIAPCFGYTPEEVDELLAYGFMPEDIEDYFYMYGGLEECMC